MGGKEAPLRPGEGEVRLRFPLEMLAAGGIALVVGATPAEVIHLLHRPSVELTFRDGGGVEAILPSDHTEERAPTGTHLGGAVTVVASTSVASSAVPVVWDSATNSLQILLRGE